MSSATDPLRNNGTPWSPADRALLAELYPNESNLTLGRIFGRSVKAIRGEATKQGLCKSDAYMASGPGQFQKGNRAWNQGKSYTAGGRSAETRFKPGTRPHNWRPIGSERISDGGYLQRKVTDTGSSRHDYRMVHHLVWEEHTGAPVPEGHVVLFRDGNKRNFDPSNLELVTRAENMRRNSFYTNLPPEWHPIIKLRAVLTRKINRRSQNA